MVDTPWARREQYSIALFETNTFVSLFLVTIQRAFAYYLPRSQRTVSVTHYEGQIENNVTTSDTNTRVGIGPTYCRHRAYLL